METVDQIEKRLNSEGYYANARLHAECKHKADIAYDIMCNPRRVVSNRNDSKQVKRFIKKGGKILYLQPKGTRKVYSKIAIPQCPVVRYRSEHKLSPEEVQIQFAFKHGMVN